MRYSFTVGRSRFTLFRISGPNYQSVAGRWRMYSSVPFFDFACIYSTNPAPWAYSWQPFYYCALQGVLCRTLKGHAHWVNTLTLNVDYILKRGSSFDPHENVNTKDSELPWVFLVCLKNLPNTLTDWIYLQIPGEVLMKAAKDRYDGVVGTHGERLVSGSDDFTLFLWNPEKDSKPIGRHQ